MQEFGRSLKQVVLAALFCTIFYLVATALAAILVRAYAPADGAVLAINWVIKCVGAFLFPLLFVHSGRALFKGIAAGLFATVLAMLLFAAIGGVVSLGGLIWGILSIRCPHCGGFLPLRDWFLEYCPRCGENLEHPRESTLPPR